MAKDEGYFPCRLAKSLPPVRCRIGAGGCGSGDLAPHEVIVVRCPCGRSVEYHKGFLQRRHRVPSDTLVFDLQFRLRCSHCNGRAGFRVTIFDTRTRGDNWKPRLERVVVAGEKGEERLAWEEVKGLDGVAI